MKALVGDGSPDGFDVKDVEPPVPNNHEVRIRVRATSINDYDLFYLRPPFPFRVIGSLVRAVSGGPLRRVRIPGCDVAGTVETVGRRVERFRPGDDVFGDLSGFSVRSGFGAFAEYVCAREDALILKPARMTFEQAAALPQAGVLAAQGLLVNGPLRAGQKILINGAGGGVGTIGVQLAKPYDVEVTGVDRASKLEMMRSIGFDHVIDFEQEDFTKSGRQYDLILDTKTNRSPSEYLRVLAPGGTYATVGGDSARLPQVAIAGWWHRRTSGKNLVMIALKQNKYLAYLKERFEAGQLTPVIDGPYELRNVRDAFRHFTSANHKGKVIVLLS
jgi:NADPH:quinone reductase-like Zn-dependent oxidoreductase